MLAVQKQYHSFSNYFITGHNIDIGLSLCFWTFLVITKIYIMGTNSLGSREEYITVDDKTSKLMTYII